MPRNSLDRHPITIIILSLILGIIWGFIPTSNFEKIITFFPYFLIGYYSARINIKNYIKKIPLSVSLIGIMAIFIIIFYYINYYIGYIIYYETSYYITDRIITPEFLCLSRIIAYFSAVIISIFVMRIFVFINVFPEYGSKTLFIYMYHTFIVLALRSLINKGYLPQNELLLLFYSIVTLWGLILLSRIAFFSFLMNPISNIQNYIKQHSDINK